ncbi:TonB-dependent receptor [soil metagenome]
MSKTRILLLGTVASAVWLSGPVRAQTATPTPTAPQAVEEDGSRIADIVVTAQKRSENLQDVPISITAITGDAITASGVNTVEGISAAVPGITLTRQSAATLIYIRGIGTTGGQSGQEGAVATFVDGVYQPSMSGSTFSLNNIERIEVLKGPQGTLYGRNATGGAVNVITRTPSYQPRVEGDVSYGNRNTLEGSFYATAGITENVAADIAAYYSNTKDGFGRNVVTGNRVNTRKDIAVRGKLLIEPDADTRIVLSGDYSEDSGSYGVSLRPVGDTTRLLLGPAPDLGSFYNIENDFDPSLKTTNWGGSARVEHDFGGPQFTSITAYRDLKQFQNLDLDFGPLPLFEANLHEANWQFTQEFQLASAKDSKLQWIAGLFYLNASASYQPYDLAGAGFAANGIFGALNRPEQKTQSYAAYGQATYPIFSDTNLTLGGRYTIDKRQLGGTAGATLLDGSEIVTAQLNNHATFKKPTWRIALDHRFSPELLAYASYSRGFKSGVYNLTSPTDPVVEPETLDAFEVGFKSDLLDRHLRLNAAAFYYTYDQIQLTIIQGAAQTLLNAAKAEVYGLDMDFEAVLGRHFSIKGGGQYVHGRYNDFPGAPISTPNPTFPFGTTIVSGDASGNRLIRTPDWSASISADLHAPVGPGELSANLSYTYNDGFTFEPDERLTQKAYSLVNGQIRFAGPDERYSVRIFARNLFDTKYWVQKTTVFTGDLGNPGYGRQFGVGLGFKF